MSLERRAVLKQLGAEVVLTPADKGMKGAIAKAAEMAAENADYFQPQQFDNPANPRIHYLTTGQEIWRDTDGTVDILVAGVGTGGSITGAGTFLKEQKPGVKVVAVEPKNSAVISGNPPGKHGIQGIGAGFIPSIFRKDIIDEVVQIADDDAFATSRALAKQEGILCGISAGGNVFAALQLAQRPENRGKTIVTIICDTGERYLSTRLYE
jgi:cysteine synthase